MDDLQRKIHQRYLDAIDDRSWDEEDPRLDFGCAALPYFEAAFDRETDPARRRRLTRVIWQFRDPAALPTLAVALADASAEVWKEALDGFVAIGGNRAIGLLHEAKEAVMFYPDGADRLEWISEAIQQIEQQLR